MYLVFTLHIVSSVYVTQAIFQLTYRDLVRNRNIDAVLCRARYRISKQKNVKEPDGKGFELSLWIGMH